MRLATNKAKVHNDSRLGNFSVLMSVYSQSNPFHLNDAIRSIYEGQTLKPRQVCVVKDGPLSGSLDCVLNDWKGRLGCAFTLVQLKEQSGLAVALNEGLSYCRYPIVARMDSDDVALPDRFMLQLTYLNEHSEIDVLGTQVEERNDDLTRVLGRRLVPLNHAEIVNFAKFRSPFNHPTVMFRKSSVENVGKYPCMYPEDYPLWGKMAVMGYNFANLPQVSLIMRCSSAYKYRRGLHFLSGEIQVLKYLRDIGFLSFRETVLSFILRLVYRLSPYRLKFLLKFLWSKLTVHNIGSIK